MLVSAPLAVRGWARQDRAVNTTTRWLLACAAAQGLSTPLLALGAMVVSRIAPEGGWGLVLLMPLFGALEGLLLAVFQGLAVGSLPKARWTRWTCAAFAVAWALGGATSFVEPSAAPSAGTTLALGLGAGAVVGLLVGAAQLRARPSLGRGWIVANLGAWAAALMAGAAFSLFIWGELGVGVLGLEAAKGVVSGLLVGAVTGPILRARLRAA